MSEVMEIPLTRGLAALVDASDYERLVKHKWHAHKPKGARTFYARRKVRVGGRQQTVLMHREILEPPRELLVDHHNGNGLDNRRLNLRAGSNRQNQHNVRVIRSKVGFKGVCFVPHRRPRSKPYLAQITVDGVVRHIGNFRTAEDAGAAYDIAATRYFGEFAATNVELRSAAREGVR